MRHECLDKSSLLIPQEKSRARDAKEPHEGHATVLNHRSRSSPSSTGIPHTSPSSHPPYIPPPTFRSILDAPSSHIRSCTTQARHATESLLCRWGIRRRRRGAARVSVYMCGMKAGWQPRSREQGMKAGWQFCSREQGRKAWC